MSLVLPAIAVGYLIGSIPFGLLLARMAGLGDIRSIGSGNIGATNVLRTGNKAVAAATLLFDILKGTAATVLGPLVASAFLGEGGDLSNAPRAQMLAPAAYAAGLAAFLGHVFPVWLGFKGGKGVATYIGVLLGVMWPVALIFCGVWLAMALITRYSSLSALISSLAAPLAAFLTSPAMAAGLAAAMSILLIIKHRPNIERLIAGSEPRIGRQEAKNDGGVGHT